MRTKEECIAVGELHVLVHSGKKGMKWGFTDGSTNGNKTAGDSRKADDTSSKQINREKSAANKYADLAAAEKAATRQLASDEALTELAKEAFLEESKVLVENVNESQLSENLKDDLIDVMNDPTVSAQVARNIKDGLQLAISFGGKVSTDNTYMIGEYATDPPRNYDAKVKFGDVMIPVGPTNNRDTQAGTMMCLKSTVEARSSVEADPATKGKGPLWLTKKSKFRGTVEEYITQSFKHSTRQQYDEDTLEHFGVMGMRWGVSKGVSGGYSAEKVSKTRAKLSKKVAANQTAKSKQISKYEAKASSAAEKGNVKLASKKAAKASQAKQTKRTEAEMHGELMTSNKSMQAYMKNTKARNVKKAAVQVGITAVGAAFGVAILPVPLPRNKKQNLYEYSN